MFKLSQITPGKMVKRSADLSNELVRLVRFFILLQVYLIERVIQWLAGFKLFPSFVRGFLTQISRKLISLMTVLDQAEKQALSQREIIRMSIQNMRHKKNRTIITIGGMSIGVGAIVFLVSIGYGLQGMVVSRIARLEEMRQADIMLDPQGQKYLDDSALSEFQKINEIKEVYPLISLVGRVNFNNSVTDAVVHGVTGDYLKNSAMSPSQGVFFDDNQVARQVDGDQGEVAGVTTTAYEEPAYEEDQLIQAVFFTIEPNAWLRVRSGPSTDDPIIGYTRRVEGTQEGSEVWGSDYESEDGAGEAVTNAAGETFGRWIESEFPIWKFTGCTQTDGEEQLDQENLLAECESGYQKLETEGAQMWTQGYIAELAVSLEEIPNSATPQVLGEMTENTSGSNVATVSAIDQEIAEFLQATISSELQEVKKIPLNEKAQKQAVINESMAQVLGVTDESLLGEDLQISFVLVEETMSEDQDQKVETETEAYSIVGILPGGQNPIIYVPFIDLRSLGIERFSQARINVPNISDLSDARGKVEALGFSTSSVADTVKQVEDLFATLRLVLGTLGMVALAVAALGMFNTLTVSLLERTREVGVLKSMGMKSYEVKNLFLTESMIMGFFGGIIGIIFGVVVGKLLGMALTFFAMFSGLGYIDISHLPVSFGITVVVLSLLVGFITGYYPAKRATRISALNALRYE